MYADERRGGASGFLDDLLAIHGVRGSLIGPNDVRFVTHLDINDGDIEAAIAAVRAVMEEK